MDKRIILKRQARQEHIIQLAINRAKKERDDKIIRAQVAKEMAIFDEELKRCVEEALKSEEADDGHQESSDYDAKK